MQMKKIAIITAITVGFLSKPALLAQHSHADHGAHQHGANAHTELAPVLPKAIQTVFENYIKIQTALAQDSLQGVSANSVGIAKAIQTDTTKTLPSDASKQAEMLAKAGDIKAAREAFKPLSDSLIKYLAANKGHRGHYVQVYCPMANARWLQAGTAVNNPYFGKSMARCGKIEG